MKHLIQKLAILRGKDCIKFNIGFSILSIHLETKIGKFIAQSLF